MYFPRFVSALWALFLFASAVRAQAPIDIRMGPGMPSSGSSDTLFLAGESDHIFPGIQGGSGSVDWMHSFNGQVAVVAGAATDKLDASHWTFGHGQVVWRRPHWTLETSMRVGSGATSGVGFHYQDYYGILTYRLSEHIYPVIKEEYINIGPSYGNLIKAGICACNLHHSATTISVAHSGFGNLATEFVSIREEVFKGKFEPFVEVSIGKILPRLINPALDLYTASEHTTSVTGGCAFQRTNRNSITLASSYIKTGPTATLSFAVSTAIKVRGE